MAEKRNLRGAVLFLFYLKKNASQCHRMLVQAYVEHALSQRTCQRWYKQFNRGDFNINDKQRGKPPKKFVDTELQALLNEDDTQTQQKLAEILNVSQQTISNRLRAMEKIPKEGK